MAWFRSAPEPPPTASRLAPFDPGATHVAAGSRFVGRIEGGTEVVIDGEVQGDVLLDGALLVGATGQVTGGVRARLVRVAGRVVGDVHGHERVELLAGGSVEGDLSAPRVIVAEGAFLTGKVAMHDAPAGKSKDLGRSAPTGGRPGGSGLPVSANAPRPREAAAVAAAGPKPEVPDSGRSAGDAGKAPAEGPTS